MENETELKIFFWIGTAIMVVMTFIVLFVTMMYQKRVYKIRQTESENLLRVSLESEKRERKRIASDFHDGVCGDLNAIRNYVTFLDLKEQNSSNKPVFEEIKSALDTMLTNVQDISYNLMPPMLDTLGLVPTLDDYFNRVSKWNTITVTSQYYRRDIPVSSLDSYELYRIIQELISNMIKHGNVSAIECSIQENGKRIEIYITDNGIPFDFYESLKNTSGMGLKNIISRTKLINAMLLQVPVDKGNKIQIYLNTKQC
ncbi:MAG TPA: ATP-binding protein [Flavobacterium sp.]